ncbi:hypothetical protein FQ087_00660 [Sporosarcina sp. ANT_H38]|uniref:hypothetical protein n=1 Tax=Sporosarcina sp. ANT_H38 TaxID=2597358 RepID=UPI0011F215C8|nr:hypothetical protein [Sporosarcina sp. ANT_H38]KAA0964876.1 hypothetical protein FQ087_00660 [Sporosarcina sp. ANT_H38]
MKKKIKSFEDFEKRFKEQNLPEVHYKEHLTSKVIKHKKVPIFLRASFISIFITLFITVSIATAMQFTGWKFFDSEGKQVYEMTTMSEEEAAPHRQYDWINKKYRVAIENSKSTIPEGKFRYFLTVEGYEKIGTTALSILMNANQIDSVAQIPNDFKKSLLLNDNLLNIYELTNGEISYYPQHDVEDIATIAEEMYSKAKENNVEYIEKEGVLSSDISYVGLNYSSKSEENHQGVQLTIYPANEGTLTTENLDGYTQLTEAGVDFLFSEESQRIYFIKEDKANKLLVSITFTFFEVGTTVEKEELISIAKSLLN